MDKINRFLLNPFVISAFLCVKAHLLIASFKINLELV